MGSLVKSSVYWIRHPDHTDMFTQGYVGVSRNLAKRWERHANRTQNSHLANAIKKYGWGNLVKKVVLIADEAYCLAMETKIRVVENIGWNIIKGGGMPPAKANSGSFKLGDVPVNKGVPMTAETKAKVSAAKKGKKLSKEHCAMLSVMFSGAGNPNFGKPMSVEQRAKISASKKGCVSPRKGVTLSLETRAKISASNFGKKRTLEQNEAAGKARLGRKQTIVQCPHCNKAGGSQTMPRWHFDNCKLKDNLL
jgi:group I intron endonuclease